MCENWLATEHGDGKIERVLYFISGKEFNKLKFKNERIIENFSEFHLWYSVFTKPIGSLFSRLNRVTCCFFSVYLSISLHTLYFTTDYFKLSSSIIFNTSLFDLTKEQVIFFL